MNIAENRDFSVHIVIFVIVSGIPKLINDYCLTYWDHNWKMRLQSLSYSSELKHKKHFYDRAKFRKNDTTQDNALIVTKYSQISDNILAS